MRAGSEQFVFYLMLGLLAWTFFAGSAAMSTGAITDNGGLLKSVWFPRTILPTATVLFNLVQYLLTVMVFLPLMLAYYQVPLGTPMLLFPVFVALQALMTIGVALILATATTFFRDVRHLVDVALAVLFWTTPIVYELVADHERPPAPDLPLQPDDPLRHRLSRDLLQRPVAGRAGLDDHCRLRRRRARARVVADRALRRRLRGAGVVTEGWF